MVRVQYFYHRKEFDISNSDVILNRHACLMLEINKLNAYIDHGTRTTYKHKLLAISVKVGSAFDTYFQFTERITW